MSTDYIARTVPPFVLRGLTADPVTWTCWVTDGGHRYEWRSDCGRMAVWRDGAGWLLRTTSGIDTARSFDEARAAMTAAVARVCRERGRMAA